MDAITSSFILGAGLAMLVLALGGRMVLCGAMGDEYDQFSHTLTWVFVSPVLIFALVLIGAVVLMSS